MRMTIMKSVFVVLMIMIPRIALCSVLWFGGEDTSVTFTGSVNVSSGTPVLGYDASYARAGLIVGNSTTVADPPANRITPPTFSATSTLWIHANFYVRAATVTTGEQSLLIRSPDNVVRLLLRQTGTAGTLKASKRDSAATITDLGTFTGAYSSLTIVPIDIQIIYGCTSSDVFNVWYDKVQVLSVGGSSLCTDAATSLNQVEFAGLNNTSGGSTGCSDVNQATCWSELIVANEDTRSMRLATLALQSSGNTQGWTPDTLANVNKTIINDSTFISDSTGNVLSQWKTPTSYPGGTWTVKAVSIEARLEKSSTGPTQFDWSWRIFGVDYLAGLTNALTTSFANYRLQQDVSPASGVGWLLNEVYNTSTNQMNIGVKSLP